MSRTRRLAGTAMRSTAAILSVLLWVASAVPAPPEAGRVVRVADGDTITVQLGSAEEKVRLIGIDTPEIEDTSPWWQELAVSARDYASGRLRGRRVTLERDPLVADRDKYGRLLRYVVLQDGTNFNEELLSAGYARTYNRFPFSRKRAFKKVEEEARRARRGRWAPRPSHPTSR